MAETIDDQFLDTSYYNTHNTYDDTSSPRRPGAEPAF
jgi:hypothetical protein